MSKRSMLVLAVALVAAQAANAQELASGTDPAMPGVEASVADQDWTGRPVVAPRAARRPGALPWLYVSFGAVQALDVYSTARALESGAKEQNPVLAQFRGHLGATLALKAATGAATIFAVERLWKKNRAGAIAVMVAANGVTAVVAAHNWRVARAQAGR